MEKYKKMQKIQVYLLYFYKTNTEKIEKKTK